MQGQASLILKRNSIERILRKSTTEPELRKKLLLVRSLRAFAANRLKLPSERVYTSYVELDRPFVVWNVAVSPEFDLDPKSWWYPVVGRLEHRGYFRERAGRRYGEKMRRKGFDVAVGGVLAYSTLGWFNDPVLSSFITLPDEALADLIFHELAHRRLFIAGDTDFNEAFAVAVAEAGVVAWLQDQGRSEDAERYLGGVERHQMFMELILELRETLAESYENGDLEGWTVEKRRQEKSIHIDNFRQKFAGLLADDPEWSGYEAWVNNDINNAEINVLDTYYGYLPAFRNLLQHSSNWESFYSEVERIGQLSASKRKHALLDSSRRQKD